MKNYIIMAKIAQNWPLHLDFHCGPQQRKEKIIIENKSVIQKTVNKTKTYSIFGGC